MKEIWGKCQLSLMVFGSACTQAISTCVVKMVDKREIGLQNIRMLRPLASPDHTSPEWLNGNISKAELEELLCKAELEETMLPDLRSRAVPRGPFQVLGV